MASIFLFIVTMVILSYLSAKAFTNMPNPGKMFHDGINKDETNNKKND